MSQEPKVTRFGADPTVDQELATKAYVDGSSGGGGFFIVSSSFVASTSDSVRTMGFGASVGQSTESVVQYIITDAFTLVRFGIGIQINTKNGATVCAFRDDGADSTDLTIAASTTGFFDSGVLSIAIAAGSGCNFDRDTTASSSGTLTISMMSATGDT